MPDSIQTVADQILNYSTSRAGGAPGIVAMAANRDGVLYEGAAGVMEMGKADPITTDSVMLLASCTKAITGTAVMQLVEEGLVSLDDPVSKYVPEMAAIEVLEGFSDSGEPVTRKPEREATIKQLLLHTAGFGYDFFSEDLARYREYKEIPSILACSFETVQDVLLFEPGAAWCYGNNTDWAGKIVENLRGKRLGEVFQERIFAPLGMQDIAFNMSESMAARRVAIHARTPDGQLIPQPDIVLPQPPEMDMGGHGLYATLPEYLKFIQMFLNDGDGPNGRVLKAETVELMTQNHLGDLKSGAWVSSNPELANSGDFFPGYSKSWGYTFQVNDEALPTGRPAGQVSWAGLANTFYWIDRQSGVGGIMSSQILPFQDIATYSAFVEFETAVYSCCV